MFAQNVVFFRRKTKLTQLQLANKSGLTRAGISLIERGKRRMYLDTAVRIADALNITVNDIVKGVTKMPQLYEKGHLEPMHMIKPSSDVCQQCAIKHLPHEPHNQQSLYYQYSFYNKHGRFPTWADAMAHCSEDDKEVIVQFLKSKGIELTQKEIEEAEKCVDQT